jgi:hypothetical protein
MAFRGRPVSNRSRAVEDTAAVGLLQVLLEDLAHRRAGVVVHPVQLLRRLEARQPGPDEGDQLVRGGRLDTRVRPDHGHDPLLVDGVGHTDDGDFGHRLVQRDGVFDLLRVDVLASGDDEFLGPTGQVEVAGVVLAHEVTRLQPPVGAENVGGQLGPLEVARHHGVRADAQFTDVAHGDLVAVVADHLHLTARHREPE